MQDLDFDLPQYNLPQTAKGRASFNFGYSHQSDSNGTGAKQYTIIKVIHWDGSTETTLGTVQSNTTSSQVGAREWRTVLVSVDVDLTTKIFAVGDVLRINIKIWGRGLGATVTTNVELGHSPQNKDGTQLTPSTDDNALTKFICRIPFKLNL